MQRNVKTHKTKNNDTTAHSTKLINNDRQSNIRIESKMRTTETMCIPKHVAVKTNTARHRETNLVRPGNKNMNSKNEVIMNVKMAKQETITITIRTTVTLHEKRDTITETRNTRTRYEKR